MTVLTVILLYMVCLSVFAWILDKFNLIVPKPYKNRPCMGRQWRCAFPNMEKSKIRDFLTMFTNSFAFNPTTGLKFSPNDSIYEVYRAIYPTLWGIDSLELETLAESVEEQYGIDFDQVWTTELTLGDLFDCCSSR